MINFFKLHSDAVEPKRHSVLDAGLDLVALETKVCPVNKTTVIKTGIAIQVPPGFVGLVRDRSSMAVKGLMVGAGVVDSGYSGDVSVVIHNLNNTSSDKIGEPLGYLVNKGDKIAQFLIVPVLLDKVTPIMDLWESARGGAGFGSSGQ